MADTPGPGDLPPPPSEPPSESTDSAGARGYDRVPPHSLEAEVSVLGAAMLSRAAATEIVELLSPEDFYRSAHRIVFEAIQDMMNRSEPVDPVTLLDHLVASDRLDQVGGAVAVQTLAASVPTAANAAFYARIVSDKALMRRVIEAGTKIVGIGYEPTDDPKAAVNDAESVMFDVAEGRVASDATVLKDLLNPAFEEIERRHRLGDDVIGLPTGFNGLDRMTSGFQPQQLIVLAARPAMGKTTLAMSMAHYMTAQLKRPVAFFTLEMSKEEIVMRMLSSEAMIDGKRIKTGQLEDTDWRKLADALGKLADAPLYIDDSPNITMLEILSKCRRLKQRNGLDMVIVDYLQLMTSHKKVDNRQQEVAEISRAMKMLAKELDVPVIALSQLNRQVESRTDKRPMLADLRESGCLTADTRLVRADTGEPVAIGDLASADDVVDVHVWAEDDRGRLVPARLLRAFPSGRKPVYRVTTRAGRVVEASGNHPFRTFDGWKPLDELTVGQPVAVARRLPDPVSPTPMDPDELVLLAHLIGEGTIIARQPVHYTSADEANLRAVEEAAARRFGVQARRAPDGRSAVTTQLYLPSPHHLTHGRRNPIAAWLDELGLWDRRSWQKRVPTAVFGLPRDQVCLFLHHLWATDGTIAISRGRGPRLRLSYATASPELARDVQLLLSRLDLRSRVRTVTDRRSSRPQYRVVITGVAQQRRFLDEVGCHGERGERVAPALAAIDGVGTNANVDVVPTEVWESVRERRIELGMTDREFQAGLGMSYAGTTLQKSRPSRDRLGRIAQVLESDALRDLATDDRYWDEVVSIQPIGEQETYDATVEGLHNFVAEGFILHNSVEQDADIVMFVYRDEVYDTESPDQGIAELIVSKHRNGATGTVKLAFLGHVTKFANLARGPGFSGGGSDGPPSGPPPMPPPPGDSPV